MTVGGGGDGHTYKTIGVIHAPTTAPLQINTTSLADGTLGQSYSSQVSATGGVTPYSWSITSGSLPAGLSLGTSTGTIGGTPTSPGVQNFTVEVKDSESSTTSAVLSITVNLNWSSPLSVDPFKGFPNSISCTSSAFCVVVDRKGSAVIYNGTAWSATQSIDPDGNGLESVSCTSPSFCVAVDGDGDSLVYNGTKWTKPQSIDPGKSPTSVSCTSPSFCVSVDSEGNALVYNRDQVD